MMSDKKKRYGYVMAVYLLGIFIGAIDTGILTPARTVVQNSLLVDEKTGIWMITAFTLAYACAMPILGKLADRIGRKYVYMCSIALFGAGSLICGLSNFADSFSMLIVGRVIQAFGGGGIMPLATAEFGTGFPENKRGMALGLVGGVYGIANILGATLGSAILDIVGVDNWQWLFFINLPICVLVVIAGIFVLPKGEKRPAQKIDIWGTFVLVIMVMSLLYSINNLDFFNFGATVISSDVYPFLILFVVLVPVFLVIEKRAADPIFNISYFKNRNIVLTFFVAFIVGICLMGMVFVPQFAENALKTPAGSGGYFVTILGLFAGLGGPFGGKLVDKFGPKRILILGFGISIVGALFLAIYATQYVSVFGVVLSLILVGSGLGFVMGTPLNYMMLENTKKEDSNSALSALSLMRSIGTTIGPMIMIGFIAQAGIAAQDNIMAILPPVSSIQIQADETLTDGIKEDLEFVKVNITGLEGLKADLQNKVDGLEQQNAALDTATAKREADFEIIKADPQFESMLGKMDFTMPESTGGPDFESIRQMLDMGGGISAADIDESLKMLDFKNSESMDFNMDGGGSLPDDVVQKMQSSSVINIVDNTGYLVTRMFEINTPAVIMEIQNGIGEGISGIQSGIDGMTEAIAGIADGVDGLNTGIDGISEGIAGVDEGLSGVAEGLDGMDEAVKGIRSGIAGIKGGLAEMQKARDGISAGIAGMQQGLAQMDADIAAKHLELQAMIDAGQPPSVYGPVQGQIQGMLAGRAALQTQLDGTVLQGNVLDDNMRKMRSKIKSMKSSVNEIQESKPKLSVLVDDVTAEKEYMVSIQAGMGDAAAVMEDISGMLSENIVKMTDAKAKLTELQSSIPAYFNAALNTYIQKLADKKADIELTFQQTINQGFTQMYYAVSVFSLVAVIALLFYRNKRLGDTMLKAEAADEK